MGESSGSEEEIYFDGEAGNNSPVSDKKSKPSRPKLSTRTKRKYLKKKVVTMSKKKKDRTPTLTPARIYLFNFFFYSAFGSLIPFLPVFFKLLGFSSLQNGILYATRPLLAFWWGPLIASFATSSKFRSLILFICVAGTVVSTFCISIVRTNDGGILKSVNCSSDVNVAVVPQSIVKKWRIQNNTSRTLLPSQRISTLHNTFDTQEKYNDKTVKPYTWKKYLKSTGHKIYHQLNKGILMKNMFLSVLALTAVSEIFMSPSLHIAQASIKFKSGQPFLNNLCFNRLFSKLGMMVSAVAISFVSWKYKCIYKSIHYFYFYFYAFLSTGCITAIVSLILPRAIPQKTSFITTVCSSCLSVVFNCNNFGYIFGLWVAGVAEGSINAFILWYAKDNGASEILIGALVALAMLTDLILHFSVGLSMKWIGPSGLLSVGIFLMSMQFFILTNVTNPLYMLPSQLLGGAAACCVRSSFIGSARSNGSKEMEKVLFFVFQAAYMGLGLGLGGLFVSIPYYMFGAQKTFSGLSIMTISYSLLYGFFQIICHLKSPKRPQETMYKKVNTCDRNGDWLVDALEEEHVNQTYDINKREEVEMSNTESQLGRENLNNNTEVLENGDLAVT